MHEYAFHQQNGDASFCVWVIGCVCKLSVQTRTSQATENKDFLLVGLHFYLQQKRQERSCQERPNKKIYWLACFNIRYILFQTLWATYLLLYSFHMRWKNCKLLRNYDYLSVNFDWVKRKALYINCNYFCCFLVFEVETVPHEVYLSVTMTQCF